MKTVSPSTSEIIGLAWCDKTSFDDIYMQTGLSESEVIEVMRQHLKPSSFRMWRRRVTGRVTKHRMKYAERCKKRQPDGLERPPDCGPDHDVAHDFQSIDE